VVRRTRYIRVKKPRFDFRRAAAAAGRPFIYLSEGVSNDVFSQTLELAAEAGAGFQVCCADGLPGKDGVTVFAKSGLGALEEWLADEGVRNIQRVNSLLVRQHRGFDFAEKPTDSTVSS